MSTTKNKEPLAGYKVHYWFGLTNINEAPDWLFSGVYSTAREVRDEAVKCYGRLWPRLYKDGYRICKVALVRTERSR